MFTPDTKAQFRLSDQLAKQVRGASIEDLEDVIDSQKDVQTEGCIGRSAAVPCLITLRRLAITKILGISKLDKIQTHSIPRMKKQPPPPL